MAHISTRRCIRVIDSIDAWHSGLFANSYAAHLFCLSKEFLACVVTLTPLMPG